jgi:dolichol-phosphate mannosyltransferase
MIYKLLKYRYVKFCFVGLTGLLINIIVLYLSKHYIFNGIQLNIYQIDVGLNFAIALAIFISIINNFIFNSLWTWSDRYKLNFNSPKIFLKKFLTYLISSWLGISIQVILSNLLILSGIHYLISVAFSAIIASFFNFSFNHFVTFKVRS